MSNPYPAKEYPGGYQPPTQQMPLTQPVKVKRARKWPWIVGIVLAAGLGFGAGSSSTTTAVKTVAASTSPTTVTEQAPAPAAIVSPPVTVTVTAPAVTVTSTEAPPPPPAPVGPATSFGDGTYLVGTDIAVGSYKTSGAREGSDSCYWARLKDDSGNNIIANNLGPGSARVTVKKGEYLEISGCDFTKS
jgi:hypothetical protein